MIDRVLNTPLVLKDDLRNTLRQSQYMSKRIPISFSNFAQKQTFQWKMRGNREKKNVDFYIDRKSTKRLVNMINCD